MQVRSVFQRQLLEFSADSLLTVLHFFQGTITSASAVIVLDEEGETEAGWAKVEAVAALGYVATLAISQQYWCNVYWLNSCLELTTVFWSCNLLDHKSVG